MLDLHHIAFGEPDRPALVILHGLFGSHTNWRTLGKYFAKSHYVLIPDLRNHGESPWHQSMTYTEMAADIARFIRNQRLNMPALLGHSMGGKVAMSLAQSGIVGIARLIVADIAPVSYRHSHQEFVTAMQRVDFSQVSSRREVDTQLANSIANDQVRQFLLQNLVRDEGKYRWRLNLRAIQENMSQLLGYYDKEVSHVDTLFIGGSLSQYITPQHHGEIRKRFPSAYIETVEQAGHWLHAEQPEKFAGLVNHFLR